MSLINQVLRDLDHRNAVTSGAEALPSKVKVVEPKAPTREWFWRLVAALALVALGWVGWVFYQVRSLPIATELAYKAAEEARTRRPASPTQVAEVPKPAIQAPPEPVPAPKPAAEVLAPSATAPNSAVQPAETLRFAYSIETPIGAPAPTPQAAKRSDAAVEKKQPPAAVTRAEPAAAKSRVERRDRVLSGPERADGEFRRGVDLLKHGRASDAKEAFAAALRADAGHHSARQALVALKLERGELEEASRLLQDALAMDPAQPDFAVALARIRVERGQLLSALDALDAAASAAAGHAELQTLRGTVLQRLGRHAEAADAYRAALGVQRAMPQAWMGLGISLEALQQKPEAAQAFRNALASGPVSVDLKTFAEQRIRALR